MLSLFTEKDVRQLSKAARLEPIAPAEKIAEALTNLGYAFIQSEVADHRPSPYQVLSTLRAAQSSTRKILKLLKSDTTWLRFQFTPHAAMDTRAQVLQHLDDGGRSIGHARFDAAISVLEDLVRWGEAAERRSAAQKGKRQKKNRPDRAMENLVEQLMMIWVMGWKGKATISRSAEDTEPVVRFIWTYNKLLEKKLPASTLAEYPRLKRALRASEQGIGERVRETDVARVLSRGKSQKKLK